MHCACVLFCLSLDTPGQTDIRQVGTSQSSGVSESKSAMSVVRDSMSACMNFDMHMYVCILYCKRQGHFHI